MDNKEKKSYVRKAGRTLLVKVLDTNFKLPENLNGLQSNFFTEHSNSYFLTFDDVKNSLDALKLLRKDFDQQIRVKFAYYRIFFTVNDLNNSLEYNTVKTQHKTYIEEKGGNVLYYKLYVKDNQYIGCGDMTVDTKETFDQLMSEENLKNFTLGCGVSGVHYKYRNNKKGQTETTAVATQ